ncbi:MULTISPECIES: lycopene cyclase domain-containing protein [Mycobacterium]|uniref:Lycopene cyclase n=1 Tax=Mycobacterium kiyosense TaxID=2871094 RepID=A0A9P3Q708_9MYCO|nr:MULTISPECIES: lycopene cyclase domain-containing protein [Mycobacterium]BDB41356.1 lycopene cyclase [Mycobacterium kiyosense]BDE13111.1 lycopene cyclase [Mycobacterium sp. 20KCMC460]GLB82069.1 lycopene cyclase [Mycobacterium kiyosense]GLB89580.1 lycopene cyclase [Mycobacterium kiyosense]GLB95211.1 lycopene cyclase [Mycobacterium kiyosense]
MSDHWQYLILLGLCLLITAPLEVFGGGVYRRLHRTLRAVLPVAAVFLVWDAVAIAAGVWAYDGRYLSGFDVPPDIPIEEVLFFLVIPVCGLLTYNAVSTILQWSKRR